jgi:DNA-binding FrmR family transcriptional regulator
MMMSEQNEVKEFLKIAEAGLNEIHQLLDRETHCLEVIKQIQKVQSTLNKLNTMILARELGSCLMEATQDDDPEAMENALKEITDVFETAIKI